MSGAVVEGAGVGGVDADGAAAGDAVAANAISCVTGVTVVITSADGNDTDSGDITGVTTDATVAGYDIGNDTYNIVVAGKSTKITIITNSSKLKYNLHTL